MRITRPLIFAVSVLLLLLLFVLPFTLPSGAVTDEAHRRYIDAGEEDFIVWDEEEEDPYGKVESKPFRLLASAGLSDVVFSDDVIPLPVDNSPGRMPIGENYTEDGYSDDTIAVEMERLRMFDSDVFVAHVKIATPSQLRTAYAGNKMNSTRTNHTSRLSINFNGIVAVNGDYYPETKAGYIVRQGEVYREKTSKNMDLLLVDENGDFHILLRGHENQAAGVRGFLEQHQIVNGFFFGPALVMDGEVQPIPKDYQFAPNQPNPRAAIGQTGPLSYILIAVNGRTESSRGVTAAELAEIMGELGSLQAYNLDGGNSATLAFHGQVYNAKPQAERSVTDIIYFATATQQGK